MDGNVFDDVVGEASAKLGTGIVGDFDRLNAGDLLALSMWVPMAQLGNGFAIIELTKLFSKAAGKDLLALPLDEFRAAIEALSLEFKEWAERKATDRS
jgi:hypothetical protein